MTEASPTGDIARTAATPANLPPMDHEQGRLHATFSQLQGEVLGHYQAQIPYDEGIMTNPARRERLVATDQFVDGAVRQVIFDPSDKGGSVEIQLFCPPTVHDGYGRRVLFTSKRYQEGTGVEGMALLEGAGAGKVATAYRWSVWRPQTGELPENPARPVGKVVPGGYARLKTGTPAFNEAVDVVMQVGGRWQAHRKTKPSQTPEDAQKLGPQLRRGWFRIFRP